MNLVPVNSIPTNVVIRLSRPDPAEKQYVEPLPILVKMECAKVRRAVNNWLYSED